MAKKAGPGRPSQVPGQIKRVPLNMRTTPGTRARLEAAAEKSGRSLVQEVEFRLEQSFASDDVFGGDEYRSIFQIFGAVAKIIEGRTGKDFSDFETSVAIRQAWQELSYEAAPQAPKAFKGLVEDLEEPAPPKPLQPLEFYGRLGSEEDHETEVEKFEAAWKDFLRWQRENKMRKAARDAYFMKINELADAGKEEAERLFPTWHQRKGD
jgi:hypothetical protein